MTSNAMQIEFKLLMDKIGAGGAALFLTDEIYSLLNIAMNKFISKRMYGNNPRRLGFEETQKRRDDLKELIRDYNIAPNVHIASSADGGDINKPNGVFVKLPSNYRHTIQEECTLHTGKRVSVTPTSYDRYNKIINDPFNSPSKDVVYRLDFYSESTTAAGVTTITPRIELIGENNTAVTHYYLRYIKNPEVISADQNCELAEHTHKEIVRMAVLEALENTENPRYQSSKIELNEIE